MQAPNYRLPGTLPYLNLAVRLISLSASCREISRNFESISWNVAVAFLGRKGLGSSSEEEAQYSLEGPTTC